MGLVQVLDSVGTGRLSSADFCAAIKNLVPILRFLTDLSWRMLILNHCQTLWQPFQPKIHMTESDFLSISQSGGTIHPFKSNICILVSITIRSLLSKISMLVKCQNTLKVESALISLKTDHISPRLSWQRCAILMDVLAWLGSCKPCTTKSEISPSPPLQTHLGQSLSATQSQRNCFQHSKWLTGFLSVYSYLSPEEISFSRSGTLKMMLMDQQVSLISPQDDIWGVGFFISIISPKNSDHFSIIISWFFQPLFSLFCKQGISFFQ